jgi:hypothetical protein
MARLVSKSGRGAVEVPDDQVGAALAQNPDLVLDSSVGIELASGSYADVAPEDYEQVAANPGLYGSVATPEQALGATNEAFKEELYGGQDAAASVLGAARGLTLGLSDVAFASTPDAQYEIEQIRTRNNIISTASEIGGALAPALFTGGESLLANALTANPSGAVTRLGASAASRVAGEGVAAKALQGAIQAGVEGAGMGLGNSITQTWSTTTPSRSSRLPQT